MREIRDRARRVGLHAQTVRTIQQAIYAGTDPSEIAVVTTVPERWDVLAKSLGIRIVAESPVPSSPEDEGIRMPEIPVPENPPTEEKLDELGHELAKRLHRMLYRQDRVEWTDAGDERFRREFASRYGEEVT